MSDGDWFSEGGIVHDAPRIVATPAVRRTSPVSRPRTRADRFFAAYDAVNDRFPLWLVPIVLVALAQAIRALGVLL